MERRGHRGPGSRLEKEGPSWLVLAVIVCGLTTWLYAQQSAGQATPSRFRAVDIYLNSNDTPLAGVDQLEFSVTNGVAKIVGIEGENTPHFATRRTTIKKQFNTRG